MGGEGFSDAADVSVEVIRMATDVPPPNGKGIRDSVWLTWGGNCGNGDIVGSGGLTWTEVRNLLWSMQTLTSRKVTLEGEVFQ